MTLTFHGAAQQVTGSNYEISIGDQTFLIDCGLFQGTRIAERQNYQPFPYNPSAMSAVLITHAHLDHIGRLPKLFVEGFRGPIYATAPTRELAHLVLEDAAGLIAEESERSGHEPLYTVAEVMGVMGLFRPVEYEQVIDIDRGVKAVFHDAGHILGSSTISFTAGDKTIVFSGDFGNTPVPILRPPTPVRVADTLILEATYGGITHETVGDRQRELRDAIVATIKSEGVLMIPAFAIERTQEILYEMDHLVRHHHIPPVPIFVDAPLAIKATEVFERYPEYWNKEAKILKESGEDFFHFEGLEITYTTSQSKEINNVPGPKVIIAGAGMMHGGRILHHAQRYLPDPKSTLLFVGYQAQGTLGRQLFDGAKRVKIHHEMVGVRARIKTIGAYSAHADQPQLLHWLEGFERKPSRLFLTHCELDKAEALKSAIAKRFPGISVEIPKEGSKWGI